LDQTDDFSAKQSQFNLPPSFNYLLFFFLCGFIASSFSDNNPFEFFRHSLVIFSLFLGLTLCTKEQGAIKIAALLYVATCSILMLTTVYHWHAIYVSTGLSPRIRLPYAAASNPVHGSLMILTGWLGFWIAYGLPRLLKIGRPAYLLGFSLMFGLALCTCIAFQSRSAILGLSAVTVAWLALGKERTITSLLLLVLVLIFFFNFNYEPLLNRGTSYRLDLWQDALSHLNSISSWLTGINHEKKILYIGRFSHPHSAYFSILTHTGLVGSISFFIFSCSYFIQGIKSKSPYFIISLLGWAALLTTSNGIIVSPNPVWIYFWLPTLLAIWDYRKHTQSASSAESVGNRLYKRALSFFGS
jgi:hypothetical protein